MPSHQSNTEALRAGGTGFIASILAWLLGAAQWYVANLPSITSWLMHLAQIGGLIIVWLSIRILRRNLKNGKNSIDPLK